MALCQASRCSLAACSMQTPVAGNAHSQTHVSTRCGKPRASSRHINATGVGELAGQPPAQRTVSAELGQRCCAMLEPTRLPSRSSRQLRPRSLQRAQPWRVTWRARGQRHRPPSPQPRRQRSRAPPLTPGTQHRSRLSTPDSAAVHVSRARPLSSSRRPTFAPGGAVANGSVRGA
jgi:hypothetical protein